MIDNSKALPAPPVQAAAAPRDCGNEERQEQTEVITQREELKFDPQGNPEKLLEIKVEPDEWAPHEAAEAKLVEAEQAQAVDSAIERRDPATLAWFRINYEALVAEAAEADGEIQERLAKLQSLVNSKEDVREQIEQLTKELGVMTQKAQEMAVNLDAKREEYESKVEDVKLAEYEISKVSETLSAYHG